MNLKELFYKNDEFTGEYRISKTKLISCMVFIVFFLFAMSLYLTDAQYTQTNILGLLIAAIIVGVLFAVPTYILGLLISKIIYRNKAGQNLSNPNLNDFNKQCPHDYAFRFKSAIEANNSDLARDLLTSWDKNDANYKYASLIYDGMPPTKLSKLELYSLLNEADKMNACDGSLKQWYRATAIQVISLND